MRLAEMEAIALNIGPVVFTCFIFFIIYGLAKQSNAGKFGASVLFFVLGLGLDVLDFKIRSQMKRLPFTCLGI